MSSSCVAKHRFAAVFIFLFSFVTNFNEILLTNSISDSETTSNYLAEWEMNEHVFISDPLSFFDILSPGLSCFLKRAKEQEKHVALLSGWFPCLFLLGTFI